jgi:hypothetical protein
MQWILPNMILIAGDGRNVGKTTFALHLIRHLSENNEVTGLKVSPHIHDTNEDLDVIYRSADFIVAEEKGLSRKDSSLLLQAGAKRVFLIMAGQEFLESAFSVIAGALESGIVVAESGGLIDLVAPGIFFFVRNQKVQIAKEHYLKYKPIIVTNSDHGFDFEVNNLSYRNGYIKVTGVEP